MKYHIEIYGTAKPMCGAEIPPPCMMPIEDLMSMDKADICKRCLERFPEDGDVYYDPCYNMVGVFKHPSKNIYKMIFTETNVLGEFRPLSPVTHNIVHLQRLRKPTKTQFMKYIATHISVAIKVRYRSPFQPFQTIPQLPMFSAAMTLVSQNIMAGRSSDTVEGILDGMDKFHLIIKKKTDEVVYVKKGRVTDITMVTSTIYIGTSNGFCPIRTPRSTIQP